MKNKLIWLFFVFYLIPLLKFVSETKFNNSGRDFGLFIERIQLKEDSIRMFELVNEAKTEFEYKYRSYYWYENPISFAINFLKPGISQVTDSKFLYEYSNSGFCGQKSKFIADVAKELNIPFRYIRFRNHLYIELKQGKDWLFFDPTEIVKHKKSVNGNIKSLYNNSNIYLTSDNEIDFENIIVEPENDNFFWKLELFNELVFYIWWVIFPLLIVTIYLE